MTSWSWGLARSHDKLKPLYLHYHSIHGLYTWQDNHLPWEASINSQCRTQSFFWAYWTKLKGIKKGTEGPPSWCGVLSEKMLHFWVPTLAKLRVSYPHDHLIRWSCKNMWQSTTIINLHHSNSHENQTMQGGDIRWWPPTHKFTWSFYNVLLWGHMIN